MVSNSTLGIVGIGIIGISTVFGILLSLLLDIIIVLVRIVGTWRRQRRFWRRRFPDARAAPVGLRSHLVPRTVRTHASQITDAMSSLELVVQLTHVFPKLYLLTLVRVHIS
jgi:hypothetical protein